MTFFFDISNPLPFRDAALLIVLSAKYTFMSAASVIGICNVLYTACKDFLFHNYIIGHDPSNMQMLTFKVLNFKVKNTYKCLEDQSHNV